jgi:hypothetical protein
MWLLLTAALSASELLSMSIRYHDPEGRWREGAFQIEIAESGPDGAEGTTTVVVDNGRGRFRMERVDHDGSRASISSERVLSEAEARTRNYYLYLYGLPMKLRDPGTHLAPDAAETTFEGRPVHELQVTYDPEIGTDVWFFYLDRETHALVGYRFYHDPSARDGEYIVLSGEIEGAGLRLPRVRRWYRNQDGGFLGADTTRSIASTP